MHSYFKIFILTAIACFSSQCFSLQPSFANPAGSDLTNVYQSRPFRIWYSNSDDLKKVAVDSNKNKIPDHIENLAIQLQTARYFFHDVYNFEDPLLSERYLNKKPTYIDVILKPKEEFKRKNGSFGNGVAFSSSTQAKNEQKGVWSLKIWIRETLDATKNVTPTHEYFHLIQYGTTYFRNSWFLEGTARWSEDLVADVRRFHKKTDLKNALRETNDAEFDKLMSYNAADLIWRPFIEFCGGHDRVSENLRAKLKYLDGSYVLRDEYLYGFELMSEFMQCLKRQEDSASKHFKDRAAWIKDGQRSPSNTQYIKKCIEVRLHKCTTK